MFFPGDGMEKILVDLTVSGIKTAVADHFEVFLWNMRNQTLYKFHYREGFFYIGIILMSIVMEGDRITIVFINTGSSYDWSTKITADVFGDDFRVAFIGLGVNIEPVFMVSVAGCFHFFERWTEYLFHFV